MTPIADGLGRVRSALEAACRSAGREPGSVNLVAVSKTHPAASISAAYEAGQRDFGENYAAELRDKQEALVLPGLRWHYIGRIQRNKAALVAGAYRVHAVESVLHAEALVRRGPATGVDALVMVNVGGEASKGGVDPAEVVPVVRALHAVPGLRVRGLTCLPPAREDPEEVAPFFAETASLLARCQADGHPMDELSMGMSHDFHVAVRFGATWVRVGTAIFGARGAPG
jgi:pyridoxal phosphate enzyme (YggS family)